MINRKIKYTFRDYMNLPESEEKRYEQFTLTGLAKSNTE